jgi:hypothetical protein
VGLKSTLHNVIDFYFIFKKQKNLKSTKTNDIDICKEKLKSGVFNASTNIYILNTYNFLYKK